MKRIWVDLSLVLVFFAAISYQYYPKALHEELGILALIVLLVHLYFNKHFFAGLSCGSWNRRRILKASVVFFLLAAFVGVMATGIIISHHLFRGVFSHELRRVVLIHRLHDSCSFLLLILSGVHLGLYWQSIRARLAAWFSFLSNPFPPLPLRIAQIATILAGICFSFLDRIGERILLFRVFKTDATVLPFPGYFLALGFILLMYALFSYHLDRHWQKNPR